MTRLSPYSKACSSLTKGNAMFHIFANTFRTATRNEHRNHWSAPSHWVRGERFDNRRNAEIEAHLAGRRF